MHLITLTALDARKSIPLAICTAKVKRSLEGTLPLFI